MAIPIDGSYESLLQGVSQRVPAERLKGQCTEQINMVSDIVKGLSRRPPTELSAILTNVDDTYKFYNVTLGAGVLLLAHKGTDIKAFRLNGTELTVNTTSAVDAYINTDDLLISRSIDRTFVINRNAIVSMDTDTKSYNTGEGIVYLKGSNYGRTYKVTLRENGSTVFAKSYTTPDGSSYSHAAQATTDYIAQELYTEFNTDTAFTADYYIQRRGDVLRIYSLTGSEFTLTADDGDGGDNMFATTGEIEDVGDFPRYATPNMVLKVVQSDARDDDSYYVFTAASFGDEGIWQEVVAPDTEYKIDVTTAPHEIVYDSDTNELTIQPIEWGEREVGDAYNNVQPSFIGNTINDVNAFQGRVVFTAGPNVFMSRTLSPGDPIHIFKERTNSLLDTDPIDITSSINYIRGIRNIVPFNRDLLLFSDTGEQYVILGKTVVTPHTATFLPTTAYQTYTDVQPTVTGENIVYVDLYGEYTSVYEYFVSDNIDAHKARSITNQVNQYIAGTPQQIIASSTYNKVLVRTDDINYIYVHEFLWSGNEKLQASWSKWQMSDAVLHMFFTDNYIYVVTYDGTDVYIEFINLAREYDNDYYQVHLDRKVYDTNVGTEVELLYDSASVLIQGDGCPNPGMIVPVSEVDGTTVTLSYSMDNGTVIYGIPYTSTYAPTNPVILDEKNIPIQTGDLRMVEFLAHYSNTGSINTTVSYNGITSTQEFTGRVLQPGSTTNLIGVPAISDGVLRTSARYKSDYGSIVYSTTSHTPMQLTRLEYRALWNKSRRRV